MMSVPPSAKPKGSTKLRNWVVGCFVVCPLVCCGGVALFSRKWVDTLDYSADLDNQLAEAKKHGLPMESKELTVGMTVSAADNSYPELAKLMKEYPKIEDMRSEINKYEPSRTEAIPSNIRKYIQRARTIGKFKSLDVKRDYDLGPYVLFPELAHMKLLAQALGIQAQQDAANHRADAAIEDLRLIRGIAHQLIHEKILIGGLVNLGINATYYRTAATCAGWLESDREAIAKLWSLIAEENPATDPYGCFLGEFFIGVTYARNFQLFGGLKGMRGDYLPDIDPKQVQHAGLPTDMMPRGMLGSFIKHELKLQEIVQSNKNMAVAAKKIDAYMVSVPMTISNTYILVLTPVWSQAGLAWEKHKLSRVMLLKCIDLIEHKKNGEFPGEIEDIPDTVAGNGTLNYHRTAGGFVIYSSGLNGKDDGGPKNKTDRRKSDDFGFEYPFVNKS